MEKVKITLFILHLFSKKINVYAYQNSAFDQNLYHDVLNSEQCRKQLEFLSQDLELALRFLDAGLRKPRGITTGNIQDWGNYFQCLNIDENTGSTIIEGKFCLIKVPANQKLQLPEESNSANFTNWHPQIPGLSEFTLRDFDPRYLTLNEETARKIIRYNKIDTAMRSLTYSNPKRSSEAPQLTIPIFTLAVCIPKLCTTQDWFNGLLFNTSVVGFEYEDIFCRLKNDKPWVAADYIAVTIFSAIGFITALSTSYDIWKIYYCKSDQKGIKPLFRSFSVYTNYKRLTNFNTDPGAIECLDGIKAISAACAIMGHTYYTLPPKINVYDSVNWEISLASLWHTCLILAVDTFLLISGLLLVYTTVGKLPGNKLILNLHLFYLNRLFRMFPLLAANILIQASFLYRLSDGPFWEQIARDTANCRKYWKSTLLYIQNYYNSDTACMLNSWYIAVDTQLYIISPIVLFWVLSGSRRKAWTALSTSLLCAFIIGTMYNFINKLPGGVVAPARVDEFLLYMHYYYMNTLTRASPFFVGMMFGYLLHLWRGNRLVLSKIENVALWILAFFFASCAVYSCHLMKDLNWDNQVVDSLVNSFARPIWAACVGWVIVACNQGYGGPINWLLSHRVWKLTSRLSYGMYLCHYPIMNLTAGTAISPVHFNVFKLMYRFVSEFSIAFLISFIMTLLIDSPFSAIVKHMFGEGPKKQNERNRKEATTNEQIKTTKSKEF